MALISCPECGKENVSDSAEMCPDCGYGIKAHFEHKRKVEQEKKIHEQKLARVSMPDEPQRKNFFLGFSKAAFIFSAIFFVLSFVVGSFEMIGSILFIFVIGIWFWYEGDKQYNKEMEKYNLAKENFERYKREEVWKQERKEREEENKPKCPQCGSKNLEKISTTDRAVSVAMVGVASGKIGKQYKCKNCKHMW